MLYQFNFVKFTPIFARNKYALRCRIVGYAVQHVGLVVALAVGQYACEVDDPLNQTIFGVDDDDLVCGVYVSPNFALNPL